MLRSPRPPGEQTKPPGDLTLPPVAQASASPAPEVGKPVPASCQHSLRLFYSCFSPLTANELANDKLMQKPYQGHYQQAQAIVDQHYNNTYRQVEEYLNA